MEKLTILAVPAEHSLIICDTDCEIIWSPRLLVPDAGSITTATFCFILFYVLLLTRMRQPRDRSAARPAPQASCSRWLRLLSTPVPHHLSRTLESTPRQATRCKRLRWLRPRPRRVHGASYKVSVPRS